MTGGYRPHLPMRPAQRCRACAAPWPCSAARLALLAEYRDARLSLAIYLAAALHDAIDDAYALGLTPDLSALHARFLGSLGRRKAQP